MKILVLLFLVGCAAASVHEALDETAELLYHDLMFDLEDDGHFYYAEDDDVKTELGKKLRETLNELIERIKERLEKGKGVRQEFLDKIKELRDKMKEKGIDLGGKAKEALEKIRERVRKFLDDLLENLKTKSRRHIDDNEIIEALADSGLKELFRKLKKIILDKIDKEALKQKIEDLFGKGNEMADSLLDMLNKKGDKYKEKLLDLIDRYLGKKEEVEKRSLKEMWEKVKNYFKDLHIDIKEKYMKFGEWVKEIASKGLEKGKDKITNIRNIAKEFIDHTKGVSKDVAVEALEFLKPYKEDLGALWDQVKDTVKDIVNRKE